MATKKDHIEEICEALSKAGFQVVSRYGLYVPKSKRKRAKRAIKYGEGYP